MASKAIDDFQRANSNSLGVAPTGQPWVVHSAIGNYYPTLQDGRAYFGAPGYFSTLNTGAGGGNAIVSTGFPIYEDGVSLYFRATSPTFYWRLIKQNREEYYTYVSGYTEPTYGWVGDGTYYYSPSGGWVQNGSYSVASSSGYQSGSEYWNYDSRVNAYLNRRDFVPFGAGGTVYEYVARTVHENQTYQQISPGQPIYSTGYGTKKGIYLQKCSNGTTTNVKAIDVPTDIGELKVELLGNRIRCFADSNFLYEVEDPFNATATRHGLGRAVYGSSTHNGFDWFNATPLNLTDYMPPLML